MARFYAEVFSYGGKVTRTAEKEIRAHVRGWNVGAEIEIVRVGDADEVSVYATGGSHGKDARQLITRFTRLEASGIEKKGACL